MQLLKFTGQIRFDLLTYLFLEIVNGFVDNLLQLGTDPTVLTEAVHASSQTIDSRHFAEEFIRRRKLADKGISAENAVPALPPGAATLAAAAAAAAASSSSSLSGGVASAPGGGWSEVAKKNPASAVQEGGLGSFKVVQAKKKGGKR
jgi:PERQ amino acid-rich with GYF domain-containing protein